MFVIVTVLFQVAAFGCKAFALLFDDIDPELSASDKGAFQSSACAQVSVTNEVFEHLNQPEFYFCPTGMLNRGNLDTVLPARSDSDVMFFLQSYQGLIINRSLVY